MASRICSSTVDPPTCRSKSFDVFREAGIQLDGCAARNLRAAVAGRQGTWNGDGFGDAVTMVTAGQNPPSRHLPGRRREAIAEHRVTCTLPGVTLPGQQASGRLRGRRERRRICRLGLGRRSKRDAFDHVCCLRVPRAGLAGASTPTALPTGVDLYAFANYAGDVNADGFADLLVTDPTPGTAGSNT